jgi:hypothetical protein
VDAVRIKANEHGDKVHEKLLFPAGVRNYQATNDPLEDPRKDPPEDPHFFPLISNTMSSPIETVFWTTSHSTTTVLMWSTGAHVCVYLSQQPS